MKLPSQDVARFTLSQDGDPYGTQGYREVLLGLSGHKVLTCSHCGFVATQDQIKKFHSELDPESVGGKGKLDLDVLSAGWGLFRALPLDFNPWNTRADNFELVCEVCFHAGHCFNPGFKPVGTFGLVNVMSQAEVVMAWRALMLGSLSGKSRASNAKEAIRLLIAQSYKDLRDQIGEKEGNTLRVTNRDIVYWIGYTKAEIHKVAPQMIADLRLLPSVEASAYGFHIAFCERFLPLFKAEAVAESKAAPERGARIEPTLERSTSA